MSDQSTHITGGFLGLIERLGNKLPDPVFLFLGATVLIMALSAAGSLMDWKVQPLRPQVVTETVTAADGSTTTRPKTTADGRPVIELVEDGDPVRPRNLLSSTGIYWLITNMVRNFLNFPPLGVVVVSMFGIGVAEKVGLFGAGMKWVASLVPSQLLTPTVVFLGIMSNVASDAGYIVLPPLAAGLYVVFGRPPLAGVAAAFAGIGGGFSANLLVGSTDALVSGITEAGARTLDQGYTVLATCNWYFMIASTFMLTIVGWAITSWIVEPRLVKTRSLDVVSQSGSTDQSLTPDEKRGLRWAAVSLVIAVAAVVAALLVPGAPLAGPMPAPAPTYGPIPDSAPRAPGTFTPADPAVEQRPISGAVSGGPGALEASAAERWPIPGTVSIGRGYALEASADASPTGRARFVLSEPVQASGRLERPAEPQPRWSGAIVPLIIVIFLTPGLAYGIATGALRTQKDVSRAFIHSMESMAPVIAMAFFAAQFIECFRYSRLDQMLAFVGGDMLASSGLPPLALLLGIVAVTMVVNLLMSSMSAKWTMLAPILVPMMMMVGISPELTQCAYRVGDSATNIVTPLNTYAIVILAVIQRYRPASGMGQLIALMVPYSIAFAVAWAVLLLLYVWVGLPTGPSAPLWYAPGH